VRKIGIGIVGCGQISDIYLRNMTEKFSGLQAICCSDAIPEKAADCADRYGIKNVGVAELLESDEVDVVLNLTTPRHHTEISLAAIRHGKHVYSEKPLAISLEDAQKIMDEANARGLRVGCAPDTILGAGIQTSLKAFADGWIGRPVAAFASVTSRGHERWHANPAFYYQHGGGPHLDMGPYYISAITAALGSVNQVTSMSSRGFDRRIISSGSKKGQMIDVEVDTHFSASLKLACGTIVTLILSFDIWATHLPRFELYGSDGTLSIPDPNTFDGPAMIKNQHDSEFVRLPMINPFRENMRGLGLAQMCHAIKNNVGHLANGQRALHVLEVLLAIEESARTGQSVVCHSTVPPNMPLLQTGLLEVEYGF
jgi:predicted dehydrogenase